jgi:hypothetical protein
MKHLQIKSDTTTYKVEIQIEYTCKECWDHGWVTVGQYDGIDVVPCTFCNAKVEFE